MRKYFTKFFHSGLGVVLSALFGVLLLRGITQNEGPEGLAKFGIFRQFVQLVTVLLTWGNGFSIIESYSKSSDKNKFLSNLYKYVLASTILVSALVLIFSKTISLTLYNDFSQKNIVAQSPLIFFGISIYSLYKFVLTAKQHLIISSFLQGLPFLLMFILYFVTNKISYYFVSSYALSSIIAYLFFRYYSVDENKNSIKFSRELNFEKSSIATIGTGLVGFLSLLTVKSISVHFLGIEEAGIIEAEFSLMNYVTLAIIAGLSTFYLSSVSQNPDDKSFREKILIFLVVATCLTLSFIIYFDHFFLGLLFGQKILVYKPTLSIFGLAEMLRCVNWFFIFTMIALGHRKKYLIYDFIANFSYVASSFLLVSYSPTRLSIENSYLVFQISYFILVSFFCLKSKVISPKTSLLTTLSAFAFVGFVIVLKNFYE